eukprot:NODE_56_length_25944_cov_0.235287.p15 type:complete len:143 gc:universal NODE_56_length_25944_cov_0.235287:8200-8628(+)
MGGGHYTAYTKHDNIWYDCDDSRVTALGNDLTAKDIIKSKNAYLLFYKRKNANATDVKEHYSKLFPMFTSKKRQNIIDSDDDSLYSHHAINSENNSGMNSKMHSTVNSPMISDDDTAASMGAPLSKTASNISQSGELNINEK